MEPSSDRRAVETRALVDQLQGRLVQRVASVAGREILEPVRWLRDGGRHGGGVRFCAADTPPLHRASVNVSAVHYDDLPEKRLASATALSAILHPTNPHAPSLHTHISWTSLRSGRAYWRVMADLNPAIPEAADTARFEAALRGVAPALWEHARDQGDRYFRIPALDRHRGVVHFYLEAYDSGDWDRDAALARRFGETTIDTYSALLAEAASRPVDASDIAAQRHYHTVYLFQVLTMDRGTTSGLLVHDQNDVGILGSLPGRVDTDLLASWRSRLPAPQEGLLDGLVAALGDGVVDDDAKRRLAATVRAHYRAHPEALSLQATGLTVPPTVANHD